MLGASSPLRRLAILLVALAAVIAVVVSGRGKKEAPDPYLHASLRAVTRGDTLSANFRFEIDAPAFEYVRGNTGVVRNGNLLEFLVAEDLEHTHQKLAGTMLGVRKTFTPAPTHLVLERIKRNGVVEADTATLKRPEYYTLPKLLDPNKVDQNVPGGPLPEIGFSDSEIEEARVSFLPKNEGEPLKPVKSAYANFAYLPRHDLPAGQLPAGPQDYAWYAIGKTSALEIVNLTEGAKWMLHLLKDKDLPIIGCFTMISLDDLWSNRRVEHAGLGHVIGKVRLDWFQYANAYIEGYARVGL